MVNDLAIQRLEPFGIGVVAGLEPDAAAGGGTPPRHAIQSEADEVGREEAALGAAPEALDETLQRPDGDRLAGQNGGAGVLAGEFNGMDGSGGGTAGHLLINQDGLLELVMAVLATELDEGVHIFLGASVASRVSAAWTRCR